MPFRGETIPTHVLPPEQPDSPSKRELLIGTAALATTWLTTKTTDPLPFVDVSPREIIDTTITTARELLITPELQKIPQFTPDRIGINLNYKKFNEYGLTREEIIPKLLAFPGQHVRLSVYIDEIFQDGHANFTETDKILDMCLAAGKTLHIVLGTKTTAGDEFNLSSRFYNACPEARLPDAVIGSTQKQRDILTEEVAKVAEHYLFNEKYGSKIASVHRTNEGYSKQLIGVTGRSVDHIWNAQEHALIQKMNRYNIPIVQNIPTDTWENVPIAMQNSDIPAINVYPQAWRSRYGVIGDIAAQTYFWSHAHSTFAAAKENENVELSEETVGGFFITEAQIAPWLDEYLQPKYSFDKDIAMHMLKQTQEYDPAIVFLWDLEQLYKNDENAYIEQLYAMVKKD